MAFGKAPDQLDRIVGFGGTSAQRAANATRKRTKRGGGSFYWRDVFKPDTMVPDKVRIVPGTYKTLRVDESENVYEEITDWFEYREHYHGYLKSSGICSAGPHFLDRDKRDPCIGCDIFWEGTKGNRAISMSNKYTFNVIDMGVFHKIYQVDQRTGQYRMNQKTNEPYTEWVKCKGIGCDLCQVALESRQGHIQPWPMSKTHFDSLQGSGQYIAKSCTTCGGRDVIETVMWQCGNPQCGELLFDIANTTATIDQIMEVVNRPYTCRRCGVTAYPEEVIQCKNCTPRGLIPQRATIYDVDLEVKAQPTGEGKQTLLIVLTSSDPKPVDQQFAHLLNEKPDLEKRFAPTPIAHQEKRWNRTSAQSIAQPMQQPPQGFPAQQYSQPASARFNVGFQQPVPNQQPAQQPVQPVQQGLPSILKPGSNQ